MLVPSTKIDLRFGRSAVGKFFGGWVLEGALVHLFIRIVAKNWNPARNP